MKKICMLIIALLLAISSFMAACAQPAPASTPTPTPATTPAPTQAIEIKAVTFLPGMSFKAKLFKQFCDKVNEAANGELTINILGGPEVIGQPEMGDAVSNGVVQMTMMPPSFFEGRFMEASLLLLSRITYEEEVKSGVHEMLQTFYNDKANVYFLGRMCGSNEPSWLTHANKEVNKPQQLAGLTVGANGPMVLPVTKALNMDLKSVPLSEAYTALERGLVDGWLAPASGILPTSAQEQIKYGIDHPYFTDHVVMVINLDTWKKLPANLQKLLQDTQASMAPELGRLNDEDEAKARKIFADAGVKYIKFSPDDAKSYLDTIYNAMWDDFTKKMPDTAPEIRKLISP